MRRPLAVALLAALAGAPLLAEDSLAEHINGRASGYEHGLDGPFHQVEPRLDDWLKQQRSAAVEGMRSVMGSAQGDDKLFVAYHILRLDPVDAGARSTFAEAKATPPYDEQGKTVGTFALAKPVDGALAEKVLELEHPSFDIVAHVIDLKSPTVSSYWDAQGSALKSLKADLLGFSGKGQDDLVYQLLAYYYPASKDVVKWYGKRGKPVPKSRWWIDHVDQYLLDHELAGVDCLLTKPSEGGSPSKSADGTYVAMAATWRFPTVRSARVEAVVGSKLPPLPAFVLGDETGGGVIVSVAGKELTALSLPSRKILGKATLAVDFTTPTPLEIELRDKRLLVSVGGLPAVQAEVPRICALRKFSIEGRPLSARSLRVRFIGSAGPDASVVTVAKAPEPPPERRQDLDKLVTLTFNDTPVDEVVAFLGRVTGLKITLDESGQTLKDLPVTLEAKDMKLSSALECLERLTDLHANSTADGIVLSWKK
jgi:hypothetical protein